MASGADAAGTEPLARAQIASALGAFVLGLGAGAMFGAALHPFAPGLLGIGTAVHGWAMLRKRALLRASGTPVPRWEPVAYWGCWVLLGLAAVLTGILALP